MPVDPLPFGHAPAIGTARLRLRAPTLADAPAIARLADNRDIARRLSRLPHPYGLDDALFYLRHVVPSEIAWAVTSADDGTFLGLAGLAPTGAAGMLELGYWLGQPYWGRGLASEAAAAIVAHAFDELGLATLASGCFADNEPSRRVLMKTGFVEGGRRDRRCLALGSDRPFIDMTLERPVA